MNDIGTLLYVIQNDRYVAIYLIKHDDLIFSEITETSKTTEQQQVKNQPLSTRSTLAF